MADNIERELGWDDEISKDGGDFPLLPEGDYDFKVAGFERGRHDGSAKLPPCNKAIITLEIENPEDPENPFEIKHNLFLHTKTEGMIAAFLIGIGQKKHGEPIKPNWSAVVGCRGRAKIIIHKWTGQDGEEKSGNQVKKFYEPEDNPTTKFTPGAF